MRKLSFFTALAVASLASPVFAEEVVHERFTLVSGLICDTEEQVMQTILTAEETGDIYGAVKATKGCGFVQLPVLVKWTNTHVFQSKIKYQLVRFDMLSFKGVQYGLGDIIKPPPETPPV